MNDKEKQEYLEKYHEEKEHGVPFYPNIIFKDVIVAFVIFLILVALASILGAPLEARANPADTTYTPKPEWYFLFLFQLLKYFPGKLEIVGVVLIPLIAILVLFFLPLLDRRHPAPFPRSSDCHRGHHLGSRWDSNPHHPGSSSSTASGPGYAR